MSRSFSGSQHVGFGMDLVISFSGGETSAYMAQWLKANKSHEYDRVFCVFANTGQENEETLDFVARCDSHFGLGVQWIESVVHHGERKGCAHKVVDFGSASRNGEPFESVIKKYGIPNQAYPHCTRELKLNPIRSWLKENDIADYHMAVGIRADEIDRMQADAKSKGLIYPLVKLGISKPDVNLFWSRQSFRLTLKGYQGNCKWCWKKSLRKHLTLLNESPEDYEFPDRMERMHGLSGHNVDGSRRVFFRNNLSTKDLRELARQPFTPAEDDSVIYPEPDLFGFSLDVSGGCSGSCEVEF